MRLKNKSKKKEEKKKREKEKLGCSLLKTKVEGKKVECNDSGHIPEK